MSWPLSTIRSSVRQLSRFRSTSQISDSGVDGWINEYYRNHFPLEVSHPLLKGDYTQATSVSDSGQYSLSDDILLLQPPYLLDGVDVYFRQNTDQFWRQWPKIDAETTGMLTAAGLAIGSVTTKVANNAFSYRISGYSYSASATETALSGDDVPANKYGAWRLEINAAGTISIVAASDNATGYATPGLAVAGIENESSSAACLGFVTVTHTSTFSPGVTGLDVATATYTDGKHSTRSTPTDFLLSHRILYVRPKADDIHIISAEKVIRPTELSGDSDTPLIDDWGQLIAQGAAINLLMHYNQKEQADSLQDMYQFLKDTLNSQEQRQVTTEPKMVRRF